VKRVEVVEFFDRLLPRQLDAAGAALLEKRIANTALPFAFRLPPRRCSVQPA